MVLNLKVKIVAQEVFVHRRNIARFRIIITHKVRSDHTVCASRKSDNSFVILCEELEIYSWFIVEPFRMCQRRKFEKISITLFILCQQNEVVVNAPSFRFSLTPQSVRLRHLPSVEPAPLCDDVKLRPDNRLDAFLLRFLVEFNRSRHNAVVGERNSRHVMLKSSIQQRLNSCRSIEQAIVSVVMKMNKLRHGLSFEF